MGHSFGCVVVSAIASGPAGSQPSVKPRSMVLVQGALSIWALRRYSCEISKATWFLSPAARDIMVRPVRTGT